MAADPTVLAARSLVQLRGKAGEFVGTGFVIAPGRVVTNAHVAVAADAVWAGDGRYPYDVVTLHPPEASPAEGWPLPDLAELTVPGLDLPAVLLGVSQARAFAEFSIVTFHPGCFARPSGEARGLVQYFRLGGVGELWKIQDNVVVPGMSGSPVIDNRSGKVCGMVKAAAWARAPGGPDVPTGGWMIPLSAQAPPAWFEENGRAHAYDSEWRRALEQIDRFQALLFQPDEPPAEITPANLLDPDHGFAPFEATDEYRAVLDWCLNPGGTVVRLVHGASGSGKTRTAVEVCRSLRRAGWAAGFPRTIQESWHDRLHEAAEHGVSLCVVIDDAEHRQEDIAVLLTDLRSLLARSPDGPDAVRIRILLLTRTEPDWFDEEFLITEIREDRVAGWIRSVLETSVRLRPLPLDDGAGALDRAFRSFAGRLGLPPEIKPQWGTSRRIGTTLDLYALAADAALSHRFDGAWEIEAGADPLRAVRDHQLRFWTRRLREAGYALRARPAPPARRLRRAVAAPVVVPLRVAEAWLLAPTLAAAHDEEHLRRVMGALTEALDAPGVAELENLYALYPREGTPPRPASLSPDRLAELIFREVCESLGPVRLRRYLAAVLWLADGTERRAGSEGPASRTARGAGRDGPSGGGAGSQGPSGGAERGAGGDGPVRRAPGSGPGGEPVRGHPALRLIARARGASEFTAVDADGAHRTLDEALLALLRAHPGALLPELTRLCGELPNAAALVRLLTVAAENCALDLLPAVQAYLPDDGRGLSLLAVTVFRRQLAATPGMDDDSIARRVRWGRSLSLHEDHLRRHEEALRSNEDAVNECRVIMARGGRWPELFARLHGDRAVMLLRRRAVDDALANGEIAIHEYRGLGGAYAQALADVLHNQGILYRERGRLKQALEAATQAIELYGNRAPRRSRAAAYVQLSRYLSELGRPGDALEAARTGRALIENQYEEAAARYAGDYLRALLQLGVAWYGVGETQPDPDRRDSLRHALDAADTAVQVHRFLPAAEPGLLRMVQNLREIVRGELVEPCR
ncbi:trypsin-like peptidase domain-containing protein [Couchioplanes caeruleus subsp. azureus]|uniref:trypsin-like peptidase domain-containing protein n=1 Tax=Couchioplanes caeruleus TaxID=56438 RepID=UPI00361EDA2D